MPSNYRFWILLVAFEIAFGLAVFALTRQYYIGDPEVSLNLPAVADQTSSAGQNKITEADLARFNLSVPSPPVSDDPMEISRLANEYFASGQYDRAADLYEKLIPFGPDNVDTYNNLGITLHYLGRSADALQKLNEGIAIDPAHQRAWLTLGFVYSQMGNTEQSRSALTNATQVGTDEEIRRSAMEMLDNLP